MSRWTRRFHLLDPSRVNYLKVFISADAKSTQILLLEVINLLYSKLSAHAALALVAQQRMILIMVIFRRRQGMTWLWQCILKLKVEEILQINTCLLHSFSGLALLLNEFADVDRECAQLGLAQSLANLVVHLTRQARTVDVFDGQLQLQADERVNVRVGPGALRISPDVLHSELL